MIKELTDEEFDNLGNPIVDMEMGKLYHRDNLLEAYRNIIDILKKYCDWKESYYSIVACWIIGTYYHDKMITYPYLYFNASKESGKSRSVRLITYLSKDGEMVNSMTEAVLFRTRGTLGIDEFERASRKGSENLMELLNSAYKKGLKVKRMKKKKTQDGEEQVVEDFSVFRPIILANIWGMDSVLEDRCLPLYLEKTTRESVSNLLEIWEFDFITTQTIEILKGSVVSCSVVSLQNIYADWNEYQTNNYITTRTNNYTKLHLFEKIKDSKIKARMLELSLPLIIIADMIDASIVDDVISSLKEISLEKSHEAFIENKDILLVDMISQEIDTGFQSIKKITEKFKLFGMFDIKDDWVNEKWVGRAIKRLMLAKEKRRSNKGVEILLNIEKAQEKIKMFK